MHVRVGQLTLIVLAAAAIGCTRPSNNEINVSDEGMKNGVAASRYLTPVALDSLDLGRALDVDKSIKDATTSFKPQDTVCASMKVSGSANSSLVRARWMDPQGKVVQDDTRIVTPSRSDTVALQVTPPNGWAGGRYQLDVYLDDRLAATRNFTVEGGETTPNQQKGAEQANPANH
jgi:hypothetical protein